MTISAPTKQKGIRFTSGSRARSITYVVIPAVPQRDPLTGRQTGMNRALRAEFKEHKFNSLSAQKAYGWSDEERVMVERHLLNHPDFGKGDGRGIFIDKSASLPQDLPDYLQEEVEEPVVAAVPTFNGPRCEWMEDQGDDTIQCDEQATTESGMCARHEAMMKAALGE